MKQATFQFYGSLNDFLPLKRRGVPFVYRFNGPQSIKHLIEAIRVPHTEIGKIVANQQVVNFDYLVKSGDKIDVYPVPEMQELASQEMRFLLDNHLGKLAIYLRMLGFDVVYSNNIQDDELATQSIQQNRILLTRDRGLLMRKLIHRGYCIRSLEPQQQTVEVVRRFGLFDMIRPFQRCLRCNARLKKVDKETILERLKPLTRKYYDEFFLCPDCNRVYWHGSHVQRMQSFIDTLMKSVG